MDDFSVSGIRRNHAATAAFNRWQVFVMLGRRLCESQRQLARATGLRTSTISNIIRDLKRLGFILDNGPIEANRLGPKESRLAVNPDAAWAVGLKLDPVCHEIALVDAAGSTLAQCRLKAGMSWRQALRSAPSRVKALAAGAGVDEGLCAGLGISVSGIVDSTRGVILYSRSFNMKNENLGSIGKELGLGPVAVERDVNCGLYAEHHVGSARHYSSFLYYLIGIEISKYFHFGLGLMLKNSVFRGLSSAAGELDLGLAPGSSEAGIANYEHFYRKCGLSLASVVNVLDIGNIVIASDDPDFTSKRLEALRDQVMQSVIPVPTRKIEILQAQLGFGGILQGAALLALERHQRALILKDTSPKRAKSQS
ncbi:MAG: ROK family protein [Chthoniobacterales bacterium]